VRPAPARKPGPRIDPVQLIAAVVGVLAGLYAILAGLTAWIAGALFGCGAPQVRLLEIGPVLVRLPQHLGDPRLAWRASDSRLLPGPVGYYAALVLAACLLALLAAPLVWGALLASGMLEPGPTDGPHDRRTLSADATEPTGRRMHSRPARTSPTCSSTPPSPAASSSATPMASSSRARSSTPSWSSAPPGPAKPAASPSPRSTTGPDPRSSCPRRRTCCTPPSSSAAGSVPSGSSTPPVFPVSRRRPGPRSGRPRPGEGRFASPTR